MKKMIITGATGGLGIALVQEYIKRGYYIFACDIKKTSTICDLCARYPAQLVFHEMDISSTTCVKAVVDAVKRQTQLIDILINGAAILTENSACVLEDFDIDQALTVYNINALGALRVTKEVLPLLKASEDRLLINLSSEAGSMTTHSDYIIRYDYCMSKAAVNMQSIILQRYLKPDGIKVLIVHPGWVCTAMGGEIAPVLPAQSAEGIAALGEKYKHKLDAPLYLDYDDQVRAW